MDPQLHKTTLGLISLINIYQRVSSENEKIKYATNCSQLFTKKGVETLSRKEKLQFCSDAVEAITSVVVEIDVKIDVKKNIKRDIKINKSEDIASRLDKEEIDFIQDITSTHGRH